MHVRSSIRHNLFDPFQRVDVQSLSSLAPSEKPSLSVSTTNAEMPLCFLLLSVVANTMAALASCALVIQAFVPEMVYDFPSDESVAFVEAAPASLPFPGSDKPKQPILSSPSALY